VFFFSDIKSTVFFVLNSLLHTKTNKEKSSDNEWFQRIIREFIISISMTIDINFYDEYVRDGIGSRKTIVDPIKI
jgi:hypothetical protein